MTTATRMTYRCLDFRPTVVTAGVQKELWFALGVLAPLFALFAHRPATVTRLTEGAHPRDGYHPTGFAADVDTSGLTEPQRKNILQIALTVLDPLGFNLEVHERDQHGHHLHIEYEPDGRRSFPEPGRDV